MRHKAIPFNAGYSIQNGKLTAYYDPDGGSCFGAYPEPTQMIKDIDVEQLLAALGVTNVNNLAYALNRLPKAENGVVRLKNFCDEHGIHYIFDLS